MKLTRNNRNEFLLVRGSARTSSMPLVAMLVALFAAMASLAQAPATTTVTGTVYLANGQPGKGTLVLSWPFFTTAAGQVVAADSLTVTIPSDGFVSVSLAPNQGATPAGEYYTAVFYMSDGSTSTQYWTVPAAAGATLAAVQAQIMPAAQAVQTVSKAYVDQAISEIGSGGIASSGGTLTGPLFLNSDPTAPLQAADKHYVDTEIAAGGGSGTVNSGATSQIAYYNANGATVAGSAATVSSGGAGAFAGLDDTAGPSLPSYLESGSDEGTRLQNAINAFISSPGAGRAVSESVPARQTTVTWATNPFAALLNANGSVNIGGVYQLAVQIQPWQTVTTQAEIDLGQYAQVDCGDVYSAYDPALGKAGIIQPIFPTWSSSTTYSQGQFASAGGVNYVSLQAANLNEAPASSPTFWAVAKTMMTMGPLAGAIASTLATQGARISNCGLYANGLTGTSAILNGWGQEGTQIRNLRITNFMVGIDVDQIAVAPGSGHNFGIYDTQIEMNEGIDPTVWGLRYGFTGQTAQSGVAENISTIGGTNTSGITKIGVEDDGGGLYLKSQWCESLTYCLLFNNLHSARKDGSHYDGITMAAANAPVFALAEDGGAAADSYFLSDVVAGDVASNIFIDKEQPTAAIERLAGEDALTEYVRSTPNTGIQAQPCIRTSTAQAASVNCPVGNSFENVALWPALLLPAKLSPLTYTGAATNGTKFMTTSDRTGGVIPFGVVLNGDTAAATSSTHHSVSVVTRGIAPIFMDGATTAGDVVVLSSSAVAGTAIGGHDSGSSSLPAPGTVYLGYVRRTVTSIPSTPSAPMVTTNCTSACSTTWTYEWTMRDSADPADQTTSAPSSTGSVSGPSTLSTASGGANQGFNSITAPTGCSLITPCDLYRTVGSATGFVGEYHSTATVTDKGMIGNGLLPVSTGMIAPPVDLMIGVAAGSSLATNSAPGLAQCDGTTISCSSGIISTAAGSILSNWSTGGGTVSTSAGGVFAASANGQYAQDLDIDAQVNFKQMCIDVQTLDSNSADLYNLAIVKLTTPGCTGSSCATTTVAAWTSPQALTATGPMCVANGAAYGASGSVTVTPGNYYLIVTGNATTAKFAATNTSNQQWSSLTNLGAGTSTSGAFGTITLNVLSAGTILGATVQPQAALRLTQ